MNPYRRLLVPLAAAAALAIAAPGVWAQLVESDLTDLTGAPARTKVVDAINANTNGVGGLESRTTAAEVAIEDLEMAVKTFAETTELTAVDNKVNAVDVVVDDLDVRMDAAEDKLDNLASTGDVAGLRIDTAANAKGVKENATAIDANADGIATNAGGVATNAGGVAMNKADIATNAKGVATNAAGVATNAEGVAMNAKGVKTNAKAIEGLEATVADHDERITANSIGVASALAFASLPQAPAGKTFAVGLGSGFWDGEGAMALGASANVGMVSLKAGVTGNTEEFGFGAGVGVAF